MFIKLFLIIETNSEYKMKNEEQVWQLVENKKEDFINFQIEFSTLLKFYIKNSSQS